ncbi:hypothetical protein G6F70_002314 [Rhizopus microsporus]|uniref:Uncharacterized protein n=1 Tax=Rhizopus microsporus TaxID=58291 RepID=A0A1X0SDE0_RHIZD|nr:hypothetical protein G6F71_002433 [Rhizopus microsporus]KAG1202368.1 hypothetical protein G6F70_002314 [Rhizopus microsporus]KAG1214172.1 hypothetical protein G6F69_002156 [Rhizopus microsporus]KAG1236645.1 hypothetical protein G6F67_001823 [Rhizopus microsporus]KAG1268405.1 hypothetical protein G6F68_001130 [Rhizopus microsporus]
MKHEPITHFIAQFPEGNVTEESVALYIEERKKDKHVRVIRKKPYALKKAIEKQQCFICDSKLERRLCTVMVNFKLGDRKFTEKCCLDEKVDKDPHVNPSKAVVGVSSRAGRVAPPIYNSVIRTLINKDRAKYELNNAKQRTGVSSRTSLLGEFEKIENEYAD